MIDINFIRKEKEKARAELKKRNKKPGLVDDILKIDNERRDLLLKIEEQRAKQNEFSNEINNLEGKEKQQKIIEMKAVSERIKELDPKIKKVQDEFHELMSLMPNITHPSVPVGANDKANVVEKKWGEIPEFDFAPKDHMTLGNELGIIDLERGVKVSGNRFYYLKNDLVKLEYAIVQYLFDFLKEKGFQILEVPVLIRERALYGTGFFPTEKNEIYSVNQKEDNLFLVGTSEVSIASYHSDEILLEEELPKKYCAFSQCFRREAGAYGKDTKGIFRVHQFQKLEMFKITTEEKSWKEYDELVSLYEEILQRLEIPYQKTILSSGDISNQSSKTIDLEGYFPGQKNYRELGSASNTTTFQSRRLKIRYKDKKNKKHFAHMMNCTAAAFPRLLIAIMENKQKSDGSISIPQILLPYLSGLSEISKKKKA